MTKHYYITFLLLYLFRAINVQTKHNLFVFLGLNSYKKNQALKNSCGFVFLKYTSIKLVFTFFFIKTLPIYSQAVNDSRGNCETIEITDLRTADSRLAIDRLFYYYSFNGIFWIPFDRTQEDYKNGLVFRVDQDIEGLLTIEEDTTPYIGPLYIKGEYLTEVGDSPDPYDVVRRCAEANMNIPPNQPLPCPNGGVIGVASAFFNIIPCSPLLVGEPVKTNTNCNYSSDAEITYSFDRKLADNEYFRLNLLKKANETDYQLLRDIIVNPSEFLDKKYTFSNLAAGEYIFRYQTFIGSQQANDTERSFTIYANPALSFSITKQQPVCYDDKGTIHIEVSGGTPPYYYKINSDAEIEFESSVDLTASEGNFMIKVRDKNNCIDTNAND